MLEHFEARTLDEAASIGGDYALAARFRAGQRR